MVIISATDGSSALLLDCAMRYRNYSIVPVIGKRAAGRWSKYQRRRASEHELERLFSLPSITGIAVVGGQVSGGLACRDFDIEASYEKWAAANPVDAARLPTVRTRRGHHVYGRVDGDVFLTFDDGELRGDSRHYTILPPSQHPSGVSYEWLIPLPEMASDLFALPDSLRTQYSDKPDTTHSPPIALCPKDGVEELIQKTLPTGPGQRNRRLFDFARHLKALMPEAMSAELRPIVQEWHRQALPRILTKDFDTTWCDFITAWRAAKSIPGRSFSAAQEAATSVVLVGMASQYDGVLGRLARLCAALQAQFGTQPFYLGCREAGAAIGVSKSEANRLLKVLEFDGVIHRESTGSRVSAKSSEWRFNELASCAGYADSSSSR